MAENNPVNNEVLEQLLEQRKELLKEGDKKKLIEHMNTLAQVICMDAKLLSVVRMSETPTVNEDGIVKLSADTKIGFVLLNTPNGEAWQPAFTSWDEVFKWKDMAASPAPPQTFVLSFDNYVTMLKHNESIRGVVINPFSDNLLIPRELIEKWADTKRELLKPKPGTHVVKGGLAAIMDNPEFKQ
ncbi:MAG: SseB family protein [Oscillospiraceae bacterium]|nr:SseB family protein [Oscillospiraceae bacterium]